MWQYTTCPILHFAQVVSSPEAILSWALYIKDKRQQSLQEAAKSDLCLPPPIYLRKKSRECKVSYFL